MLCSHQSLGQKTEGSVSEYTNAITGRCMRFFRKGTKRAYNGHCLSICRSLFDHVSFLISLITGLRDLRPPKLETDLLGSLWKWKLAHTALSQLGSKVPRATTRELTHRTDILRYAEVGTSSANLSSTFTSPRTPHPPSFYQNVWSSSKRIGIQIPIIHEPSSWCATPRVFRLQPTDF